MSNRFADARKRLAAQIGNAGVAVIPAAMEITRSHDVGFDFHQDPDFLYLTGFYEPDAVAVIAPGHPDGEFALFVRPRDREQEVWNGYRAGVEGAREHFGADAAFGVADFETEMRRYVTDREAIWYANGNPAVDKKIATVFDYGRTLRDRLGSHVPLSINDVSVLLHEMRLIKSPEEQDILTEVCALSAAGHREAMKFAAPGQYEYQVQEATEYLWRMAGAQHNGYPSIVAAGANACILHYVENTSQVEDGDLILIDAAAELSGYSSDITRTFPANGKFTSAQRRIYEVVLAAEKNGVAGSVPGGSFDQLEKNAARILTEGLVDLGLLPLSVEESLAMHHYRAFFFHGLGHWIGLDVHDRSASKVNGVTREFAPGMTFTIEPGLYVAPDKPEIELALLEYDRDERFERRIRLGSAKAAALEAEELEAAEKITHRVPEEFLGIGVRIEDDVLVTVDGNINLSSAVPVEIDEIEGLCAEASGLPRP
jgi:Xaa-Pro aminopeptidase